MSSPMARRPMSQRSMPSCRPSTTLFQDLQAKSSRPAESTIALAKYDEMATSPKAHTSATSTEGPLVGQSSRTAYFSSCRLKNSRRRLLTS